MDELAKAFKQVRDATMCNDDLSMAEKLAVLELVRAEVSEQALSELRRAVMSA